MFGAGQAGNPSSSSGGASGEESQQMDTVTLVGAELQADIFHQSAHRRGLLKLLIEQAQQLDDLPVFGC